MTPARLAGILAGAGGAPRSVPAGFGGTVPSGLSIYRTPATRNFTTTLDSLGPTITTSTPGVVVRYVDVATGNNSNAGTEAAPLRSISTALTQLSGSAVALAMVKGGLYVGADSWNGVSPNCASLAVVSWDGQPVVSSVRTVGPSWTLVAAAMYSTTISTVSAVPVAVFDAAILTAHGDLGRLTQAASQAACQATAGTYFWSSTTLYVHTFNDRAPDSDVHVYEAKPNGLYEVAGGSICVQNVQFLGGQHPIYLRQNASNGNPAALLTGSYRYIDVVAAYGTNNGVYFGGSWGGVSLRCTASSNKADGFSYHTSVSDNPPQTCVEIGCTGRWNGDDGGSNQGSTFHDGYSVIRVGGTYTNNQNMNLYDVNTGSSWNLGCTVADVRTNTVTNPNIRSGVQMWLDCCTSTGAQYDLIADSGGAAIYCNEFVGGGTEAVPQANSGISLYYPDGDAPSAHPLASLASGVTGYVFDVRETGNALSRNLATAAAVGDRVGRLLDRSGQGRTVSVYTTSRAPTLRSDGTGRYLEFDGSDDQLLTTFSMSHPMTRISLMRLRTHVANRYIFSGSSGVDLLLWTAGGTNKASIYAGTSAAASTIPIGSIARVVEVFNGASSFLEINGTRLTGNPGAGASVGGIVLGNQASAGAGATLDLYAQIMVNRVMTQPEIDAVLAAFA